MFSSNQLLELFVVLCTIDYYRYVLSRFADASAFARSKSGPVRPDSIPRLARLTTLVQGLVTFLPPTVYVVSVVAAGFKQPQWMRAWNLPDVMFGMAFDSDGLSKNALRVFACIVSIAMQTLFDDAFGHLGDQFHPIGRREKSRIVQTGPYAWVRHPLYALSLVHTFLWTIMFWSWAPLVAVVVCVAIYTVKISVEEDAILRDDAVKEEYRAYMRKVPKKLVPFVW